MINIGIIIRYGKDRESIVKILTEQDDFKITCIGEDGYDFLNSVKIQHPDIIIMDYSMNNMEIFNLAPIIKCYSPSTAIIVLYSPNECEAVKIAIRTGVSGCFQRQEKYENIASSIRCVYNGDMYFSGLIKNTLQNNFYPLNTEKNQLFQYDFSATELNILNGIALGRSDKEIAGKLNITQGSVRNSICKAVHKIGLKNRNLLPVYALFAGLINPEKVKEQFLRELGKKAQKT